MAKQETTIDDLAQMVQMGFQDMGGRMDILQSDVHALKSNMSDVQEQLDRIEKLVLVDHKHRIERLEFEVKNLKDLFALK